jgi:hypothetical protein
MRAVWGVRGVRAMRALIRCNGHIIIIN